MLGVLTRNQSLYILQSQILARLGCYGDKKVYVVPVTYVYDGKYIYARSKEGHKIRMMRKHPMVCFQVDQFENMANWRSVIVQGEFEELKTRTLQLYGIQLFQDRFGPILNSEAINPTKRTPQDKFIVKELKSVVYRVSVEEISGRYEKSELINR
jgi:nitroimidazol reductase NimA-like FMN-containing flavoprotein (pyridoxamine 5'-phosphate oxidase superfamily)